jgi:hypothetical protein
MTKEKPTLLTLFLRKENDKGKTNITNIILAEQSELVQTDMLAVRP